MSVSSDLQTIINRLGRAVIERRSYGRAELDGLRTELGLVAGEARELEAAADRQMPPPSPDVVYLPVVRM